MQLHLHVGMQKTGSTSIQSFLSNHFEELIQQGFYFTPNDDLVYLVNGNFYGLVEFFKDTYSLDSRELIKFFHQSNIYQYLINHVNFAADLNCDKFIISAEGLSTMSYKNVEQLNLILKTIFSDIYVHSFIRNPSDLAFAHYSEQIKNGLTLTFQEYLIHFDQVCWRPQISYNNYSKIYKNFYIYNYDDFDNVVDVFLHTIDFNLTAESSIFVNKSFDYFSIELIRISNKFSNDHLNINSTKPLLKYLIQSPVIYNNLIITEYSEVLISFSSYFNLAQQEYLNLFPDFAGLSADYISKRITDIISLQRHVGDNPDYAYKLLSKLYLDLISFELLNK
jgi:hypothetical protein